MTYKEQLTAYVRSCAESIGQAARDGEITEYLDDVLDVEVISDLQGSYRGVVVALTLGGPNIYLNTRENCVKGYWGSDRAEWHVKSFAVDAVDDYFSELWEVSR